MSIFVVIPNWDGADLLADCLRSLEKQTLNHRIIVVDNGSVDESIGIIEKDFKEVVLLKNSKNLGFAGGVNTGIRYALKNQATAIALFNNDAIADEDWLKNLHETLMNEREAGIVTCKILLSDKVQLDSTGDFYSVWGIPFPRGRNLIDKKQFDSEKYVFGASGGASIYKASMLRDIGIFDERFFAYYEDVDISFRAQLAGWKVIYEPKAIAYHELSATSNKLGDFTRYHSIKNFLILYTKNMPAQLYWKYLPVFLYQFLRTTVRSIINRKMTIWLKAVITFLKYLPSILKDRRNIQKLRKVDINYIEDILYKSKPPKIPTL